MEVKFQVGLQTILELYRTLETMEPETMALWILSTLMSPFIISSLWNLGMTVIWQMFWLGMKAGFILIGMSVFYMAFAKSAPSNWRYLVFGGRKERSLEEEGSGDRLKCTLLDVILSVVFQAGIRFPAFVWDPMMELAGSLKGKSATTAKKLAKETVTVKKERLSPVVEENEMEIDDFIQLQRELEQHSQSSGGEAEPDGPFQNHGEASVGDADIVVGLVVANSKGTRGGNSSRRRRNTKKTHNHQ